MNNNLYNSSSAFLSSSRISTICFANNSNNSIFLATILTQAIQALVYSRFPPKIQFYYSFLSSLSPWDISRVDSEGKFFEI